VEVAVARESTPFWGKVAATVFYPTSYLTGQPDYRGQEYLPSEGGALVVANHISYLDPLYTALWVHSAGRMPRFLAKASLWKIPVFDAVLAGTGQIPVYRDSADAQQSLRDGVKGLEEGKVVVIYPEGTITRDPAGWPMHSRTGAARLALSTQVPVVPVVHWGTREIYDHYNKRFRPLPRTTVTVRGGAPLDLAAYRDRPIDATLLREVTDLMMGRCRELLGEVRGETPPATFFRRGSEAGA
jgi:1-acyl-sn-glycerol-3-phosphate acyltransferase